MFPTVAAMSNSTSLSEEATGSSGTRVQDFCGSNPVVSTIISPQQTQQKIKKKRSLPGNPDPDAEVIALSPNTLLATNRFVCEICNKGFQRDQNLQLHRRGHNLPWKLKQRSNKEIKKRAYVCPEPTCVHHDPSRALGDLTGIKKHYCRKHGEKKWKCEKCSKIYAVQSDWKAHSKICGTREYRCDCGTLFSRKDSFVTHRAFCDALAEESARLSAHQLVNPNSQTLLLQNPQTHPSLFPAPNQLSPSWNPSHQNPNPGHDLLQNSVQAVKPETHQQFHNPPLLFQEPPEPLATHKGSVALPIQNLSRSATSASTHHLSATALLQKAATLGATQRVGQSSRMAQMDLGELGRVRTQVADSVGHISQVPNYLAGHLATWQSDDRLTRDFLGLTGDGRGTNTNDSGNGSTGRGVNVSMSVREMLACTGGLRFQHFNERDQSLLKPRGFGFAQPSASETWSDC
uniref:Zinc finger protein NUTCRACKER-like n=1 Tax=Rhizophora mucronata TaxID=61149 RepID=A0A2P2M5K8_RHIMU